MSAASTVTLTNEGSTYWIKRRQGEQSLTVAGAGDLYLKAVGTSVTFQNNGADLSAGVRRCVTVTVDGSISTLVSLMTTGQLTPLDGGGSIVVTGGALHTDLNDGPGCPNFSGAITLQANGLLADDDMKDLRRVLEPERWISKAGWWPMTLRVMCSWPTR